MAINNGGKMRLKILLVILGVVIIAFGIVFYFYGPYSQAAKGGNKGKPTSGATSGASGTPTAGKSSTTSATSGTSPTSSTSLFSDDFSGTLSKWTVVYTSASIVSGQLDLIPSDQTYNSSSATHAPLIAGGDETWKDYIYSVKMKTVKQLRPTSPNPWEVGWVIFRYQNASNFYYFIQKTNGIELGKLVNGTQKFLYTAGSPTLPLDKFNTYQIILKGNNIKISIDGSQVVNYTDSSSPFLSGKIGLYNEDAETLSDDVSVTAN